MISDEEFNGLSWENIDGRELEALISGRRVRGVEPIDYPLTDGIIIYLQDNSGGLLALEVGTDSEQNGRSFYTDIARVPRAETKTNEKGGTQ